MIYHITTQAEWHNSTSGVAVSVQSGGFIHCCTFEQLPGVRARYFAGQSGLLVLHLDERHLPDVRYEPATGGELFPHVYGAIPREAVVDVTILA